MAQKELKKKGSKKVEIYIKCLRCGEEIKGDTHKKMIYCKCEKIGVDGCEHYIRIIGESKDYKIVKRKLK